MHVTSSDLATAQNSNTHQSDSMLAGPFGQRGRRIHKNQEHKQLEANQTWRKRKQDHPH